MGEEPTKGQKRRKRAETIQKIVSGLTDPEATTTLERVAAVAKELEYENVAGIIGSGNELIDVLLSPLQREGKRYTAEQAAARAGITIELFRRVNLASGFADPEPDAKVFTQEDIDTFTLFVQTTDFFGEDIAIQNIRVMGSTMSRVADAFISAFATAVGRQSQTTEFGADELAAANKQATSLIPSSIEAMGVLLRRQLELKSRPDIALGADFEGVDALDRAVGFCDLVGYTAMTQQISNTELAEGLRDFETVASDLIVERHGALVKLIGDEVMFVAPDAATAFDIGLCLVERFAQPDALSEVRVGVSAGRVITREGDYFGPEVNLAARIVKLAEPSTMLAPASLVPGESFRFADAGAPDLKGFEEPVPLVQVTRA